MDSNSHRRAGDSDAGNTQQRASDRRTTRKHRGVVAAAASLTLAALPLSAVPANAAVTGGESIEVFTGSNLVSLTGYPANTDVLVEVLRQGIVIGYATKTSDAEGAIEMNHVGGSDCFESPTSPDIVPGDTMRTTVVGTANVDTSVVRGVFIEDIAYGANSITVTGEVTLNGPAAVAPGADVLELRINKDTVWDVNERPNRRDRREDIGASVQPDGSFVHVLNASAQDVAEAEAGSETFLEWSAGAAAGEEEEAFPSELTVAEFGPGEAIAGCPPMQEGPTAPQLARAQDSGVRGDHITNKSLDLDFAGLAGTGVDGDGGGNEVTLFVDGVATASTTANAQSLYSFADLDLAPRAQAYRLKVRSVATGEPFFESAVRTVKVDTAAPVVRNRQFRPNPLHLQGPERLHAVYRIGEAARLSAEVQHLLPTRTVLTFRNRNIARAGVTEYNWNGKNEIRRDVRPGRYRLVLTVTDAAGNRSVLTNRFRVVR